ncbi:MAG: GH1 family beta-glucosidase [Halochromatium sp.]|uniref:GH1 family beta-glucosidase n=1 Tax=Halochromatium sp. TaxID=2049430 RepID=UPI00397D40D4
MRVQFPDPLLWGAATSAYQIEGAPTADGKVDSIWDRFTARRDRISDGTDGAVACEHYRRYREDMDLMADLALQSYRFSIAWPRVMRDPAGQVNARGLDFYERLVDGLLARGIRPFATLYHWDLPWFEEQRGGWEHRETAWRFADYAEVVARRLGDRVQHWVTINEPLTVTAAGYLAGQHAPGRRNLVRALRAAHHLLLAHGAALEPLRAQVPGARVGPALNLFPVLPQRRGDVWIAERLDRLANRFFADPILRGRYPPSIRPLMGLFNRGMRPEDSALISQPVDFIGVNHYSHIVVKRGWPPVLGFRVGTREDPKVRYTDMDWEIYPQSFLATLTWLRERYGNPPVYVTENGAAFDDRVDVDGEVRDPARRRYLAAYLVMLRKALDAGSDIRGYFVWSLLDNFEWAFGLSKRFGLVHVDYATQRRTPKTSARWYAEICRSGGFDVNERWLQDVLAGTDDAVHDLVEP